MLDLERTMFFALALLYVFVFLVSQFPCLPMARITEVMRAKAEEQSHTAAVAALVINEGLLVLFAEGIAIVRALKDV